MKNFSVASLASVCVVFVLCLEYIQAAPQGSQALENAIRAAKEGNHGHINGQINQRDNKNWDGSVNAGAGVKAWESQNGRHKVGVGINAEQRFGRDRGHSYNSRPNVGVGIGYVWKG